MDELKLTIVHSESNSRANRISPRLYAPILSESSPAQLPYVPLGVTEWIHRVKERRDQAICVVLAHLSKIQCHQFGCVSLLVIVSYFRPIYFPDKVMVCELGVLDRCPNKLMFSAGSSQGVDMTHDSGCELAETHRI